MKIPWEIIAPFLANLGDKPQSAAQRAEPVGEAARLESMLSFSGDDQPVVPNRKGSDTENGKALSHQKKPGTHRHGEDRRKEDRRKETRPVMLDTRASRSRRQSWLSAAINFEA